MIMIKLFFKVHFITFLVFLICLISMNPYSHASERIDLHDTENNSCCIYPVINQFYLLMEFSY